MPTCPNKVRSCHVFIIVCNNDMINKTLHNLVRKNSLCSQFNMHVELVYVYGAKGSFTYEYYIYRNYLKPAAYNFLGTQHKHEGKRANI